jgi:tRNA G10  N-methylase Trm11
MKDMSGTLGKNDRKTKDTHPDYSGSCVVDGTAYWISGWIKESARGKFFSLSFKQKDVVQPTTAAAISAADFDDSLPF